MDDTITDSLLDPFNHYIIYRIDRKESRGGGLLLLVPNTIQSQPVSALFNSTLTWESLVIKLHINKQVFGLGLFYRTPKYQKNDNIRSEFLNTVKEASQIGSSCFIIGDFNLPNIDWGNIHKLHRKMEQEFIEAVTTSSLIQLINEPTIEATGNCVDLLLTNAEDFIDHFKVEEEFAYNTEKKSDHKTIHITTNINILKHITIKKFRNFAKTDWRSVENVLCTTNWEEFFNNCSNTNQMIWLLHQALTKIIELFVPIGKISSSSGILPTYNKHLSNLCKLEMKLRKRNQYIERFQNHLMTINMDMERKDISKRVSQLKAQQKIAHEERNLPIYNSKQFFKHLRKVFKRKTGLPTLTNSLGLALTDDSEKAAALNSNFASNYITDDGKMPPIEQFPPAATHSISFEVHEVFKTLGTLKGTYGSGPDGIPNIFLKKLALPLAQPLSFIFRHSFFNADVPDLWKHSSITPIPKTKNSSSLNDYRPISITSNICKVMEKRINKEIIEHCVKLGVFDNQYGFVPGKSSEFQLLHCVNHWTKNLNQKLPTDVIYCDFAKVFEKVSHPKLLHKMRALGINKHIIDWVESFLDHRSHVTRVGESVSDFIGVGSGIPQGSPLAPTLFLIMIHDLPKVIKYCKIFLFADDAKIFISVGTPENAKLLQLDIDAMCVWSEINQLPFNPDKFRVLHIGPKYNAQYNYTISNINIPKTEVHKDLGIWIDENLNFNYHNMQLISSCNRITGAIKRSFRTRKPELLMKMFNSVVRSKIEYCYSVWCPHTKGGIDEIEKIQKSFTRSISSISLLPYCERLMSVSTDSLLYRRILHDLSLVHKTVHNQESLECSEFFDLEINNPNTRTTRGHSFKIKKQRSYDKSSTNFWSNRIVNIWNALPDSTVNATTPKAFKTQLSSIKCLGSVKELNKLLEMVDSRDSQNRVR